MNKKNLIAGSCGILLSLSLAPFALADHDGDHGGQLRASLSGLQEVPTLSTAGHGTFSMKIAKDGSSFDYTLTFSELEGAVSQSHIHLGQQAITGGIMIWLCQGTSVAPATAGTVPNCPVPGGTVTGTITSANVIGPAAQGVDAGWTSLKPGGQWTSVFEMRV